MPAESLVHVRVKLVRLQYGAQPGVSGGVCVVWQLFSLGFSMQCGVKIATQVKHGLVADNFTHMFLLWHLCSAVAVGRCVCVCVCVSSKDLLVYFIIIKCTRTRITQRRSKSSCLLNWV